MYLPGARWSRFHLMLVEYFKRYMLVDFFIVSMCDPDFYPYTNMYLPGARWSHFHLLRLEYFKGYKLVDFSYMTSLSAFSTCSFLSLNLENLSINKVKHLLLLWSKCSSSGYAVVWHFLWMEACLTMSVLVHQFWCMYCSNFTLNITLNLRLKPLSIVKLLFLFFEICGAILIYIMCAILEKMCSLEGHFYFCSTSST